MRIVRNGQSSPTDATAVITYINYIILLCTAEAIA